MSRKDRDIERIPHDKGDRDCTDTAGNQEMPRIADHYQKLGEARKGLPESQKETHPAQTLTLNFHPKEL